MRLVLVLLEVRRPDGVGHAGAVGRDLGVGDVPDLREVVEARSVSSRGATLSGSPDIDRVEEEMGDLLFTMAHLSRQLGIEPETALRKANDKFTKRFETMESAIESSGRKMSSMTLEELEAEWQHAKKRTA